MSFFVRSQAGFTKRLSPYLQNNLDVDVRVWVDGPYGGIDRKLEVSFDNIILIAGGGGITACLPWLEHLANAIQSSSPSKIPHVKLVWAVRKKSHMKWIIAELDSLEKSVPKHMLEICIHVTDQDSEGTESRSDIELTPIEKVQGFDDKELQPSTIRAFRERTLYSGRPSMDRFLTSVGHGRTVVIGRLLHG
jgi:predicted ferric reductase